MPIPVLMYHALVPTRKEQYHRTVVTEAAFAAQMEWLHSVGYTSVTLNEARELLNSDGKYVVITFDDGYTSMHRYALPVLQKFGFTATLFLCTGGVDTAMHPQALLAGGEIPIEDKPLTCEEIEALRSAGWCIEAHSHLHLNHAELEATAATQEMEQSKKLVQGITGEAPTAYAYPFGAYSKETLCLVASRFDLACTTHQGLWKSNHAQHRIPRIEVHCNDDLSSFARKMSRGYGGLLQELAGHLKEQVRRLL